MSKNETDIWGTVDSKNPFSSEDPKAIAAMDNVQRSTTYHGVPTKL